MVVFDIGAYTSYQMWKHMYIFFLPISWTFWNHMGLSGPYVKKLHLGNHLASDPQRSTALCGTVEKFEGPIWVITVTGGMLLAVRGQEGQECRLTWNVLGKCHTRKHYTVLHDSLMTCHIYIYVKILSIITWT